MSDPYNLQRFIDAQEDVYATALAELRAGSKRTHWMWFIFPQIQGLGHSPTAQFYALASLDEARGYLGHPVLGMRLRECLEAVLPWHGQAAASQIFGPVDALKFKSSLTLFDMVAPGGLFDAGLANFFAGERDQRTLALLNASG